VGTLPTLWTGLEPHWMIVPLDPRSRRRRAGTIFIHVRMIINVLCFYWSIRESDLVDEEIKWEPCLFG